MKYQKIIRTALWAVCVGVAMCLTGCSISFCGFQPGRKEELVFSCGDHPAEEAGSVAEDRPLLPENEQEGLPVDGQPEEAEQESPDEQERLSDQPGSMETEQVSGTEKAGIDGRVNINSAGMEELMTLNGIGETRAKAIVEYRTQNGRFTKAEDIMQVPGIKEGIFSKIQNQIAVD